MARRSSTRTPSSRTSSRAASSRRGGRAAAVEQAEASGPAFEDLLVIATTVILVAAFLMVDAYRGGAFGEGLFFK